MRSQTRCPVCDRRRKPSHEQNLRKNGCPKFKSFKIESSVWPEKQFTGGGSLFVHAQGRGIDPKKASMIRQDKQKTKRRKKSFFARLMRRKSA